MYPVIRVSPFLEIPTYYLVLSVTISLGLIWLVRRAKRFQLSTKVALDLSLIVMVTGFIGGRLFHVFYEDFEYYRENLWRILHFWNGGFVFYGGALLAGVFALMYLCFKAGKSVDAYLDLFAPVLSFSYAAGRSACLLAGCCYGRYCDLPWAIGGRHPTQAYAVLWELGVLFILLGIEKVPVTKRKPSVFQKDGSVFFLWMILHAVGRLLMENFRDDFRGPNLGISISSWISVCVALLGVYLLFRKPAARRSAGVS
ncbi:prolipoprotein diacylglyceryl transferase [Bdellovibrio sp. BCCA]|uniref:prolipoprotein diacylglyceryl transferase n=1 Tax=Bdellovibrio sp. BCCA TaxID=3136281 RepID=UPI0030F285C2